jgi:hypothetical protein
MNSPALRELNLLTVKPFLYVFNADEGVLTDDARRKELAELVAPAEAVFLDAKVEQELLEIDDESAAELLESIGQTEPGLDALARAGFRTLGLQTYLTAGPKESRAWTIPIGATARRPGSSTPTSSGASSRPRSSPTTTSWRPGRCTPPAVRARSAWRARTTSCTTATWSSSASDHHHARDRAAPLAGRHAVHVPSARSEPRHRQRTTLLLWLVVVLLSLCSSSSWRSRRSPADPSVWCCRRRS